MNNWHIGKSNIHGVGLFANQYLLPNTFIDVAIDNNQKITFFGSKINHSWKPSCKLIYSPFTKTYNVYSIKSMNYGDEITVDYTFTPSFIKKPLSHWT
jgi:SET domain-containing protein